MMSWWLNLDDINGPRLLHCDALKRSRQKAPIASAGYRIASPS